ncbi:uncharacterized protein LOC123504231 [Portunus trituberculatus]|uniref:uncharacterized protein LOC123504231 n=1 Tax=Portunus trituberculatus TaxID=210409 RepID=UPI001E1CD676|nr:uncharacterized protein LOC123504231 [Portunus trituberculatus]
MANSFQAAPFTVLDKLTPGPPRPSLQVLLPIPMSDPPAGQYCRFRSLLPQGVSEGQGRAWEAAVAEQCGGGRVLGFHLRVRSTVSLCCRSRQRQERLPPPAPAALPAAFRHRAALVRLGRGLLRHPRLRHLLPTTRSNQPMPHVTEMWSDHLGPRGPTVTNTV